MRISYEKEKLRALCNDDRLAKKKLGGPCAKKLRARLDDLDAASSLDDFRWLPGGCHELKGNRAGRLALDLAGGWRLVFRPEDDPVPTKSDGGLDWKGVTCIFVVAVEDYHD